MRQAGAEPQKSSVRDGEREEETTKSLIMTKGSEGHELTVTHHEGNQLEPVEESVETLNVSRQAQHSGCRPHVHEIVSEEIDTWIVLEAYA